MPFKKNSAFFAPIMPKIILAQFAKAYIQERFGKY